MRRFFQSNSLSELSPFRKIVSYFLLGTWTVIALFPFYWLFITGFKSRDAIDGTPRYLPFIDFQPTLDAWKRILTEAEVQVWRQYGNTVVVGIMSALLALVIGTMASYALTRFEYRPKPAVIGMFILSVIGVLLLVVAGLAWYLALIIMAGVFLILTLTIGRRFRGTMNNEDISFWLVSQRMLPPIAVILPIYIMFQQLRLLNTLSGLILVYTAANLPLVIWFMRDYFTSLPIELEECAFIDGANRYETLVRIVLPLAMPGLVAVFLIVLVFTWNEYTIALFLTGGDTQTLPLLISGQNATRGPQWDNISVLVTMMIAPIVAIAIILERFIVRGLLVGAVKG